MHGSHDAGISWPAERRAGVGEGGEEEERVGLLKAPFALVGELLVWKSTSASRSAARYATLLATRIHVML